MKIKILTALFALALLGCAAKGTAPTVYTLDLNPELAADYSGPAVPLTLVIENVATHEALKSRRILASPAPYRSSYRAGVEWAESAETLLGTTIFSYLSPRLKKALPPAFKNRVNGEYTLLIYLDALTQVKRGPDWFAVLKLNYELVKTKGGNSLLSGRFAKSAVLLDGSIESFAQAESALLTEWLEKITAELQTVANGPKE